MSILYLYITATGVDIHLHHYGHECGSFRKCCSFIHFMKNKQKQLLLCLSISNIFKAGTEQNFITQFSVTVPSCKCYINMGRPKKDPPLIKIKLKAYRAFRK